MRGLVQKRITKLLRRFPISLICAGFLPPAVSTGFDKHASESIHAHRRNSSIIPGDWAEQQQRVLRDSVTLDSYISSPYVRSLKTFPFQSILSSVTRVGAPRATVAVDFQPWTLGIPSGMFIDIVHYPIPQRVLDRVIGASRLATNTTLKPCKGVAPLPSGAFGYSMVSSLCDTEVGRSRGSRWWPSVLRDPWPGVLHQQSAPGPLQLRRPQQTATPSPPE